MSSPHFQEALSQRAEEAGVTLDADLAASLALYFELLTRWNRRINLTGSDLDCPSPETLDRLLIEPLLAARYVGQVGSLLDLGSGGGSPAVPMTLASGRPRLTMVEAKTRKSVFLREVIRALGLSGAQVLTARYESLLTQTVLLEAYDVVSVRAVRLDAGALQTAAAFARPRGAVVLFRSSEWESGIIPGGLTVEASHPLITSLGSRLIVLRKSGS